MRRSTVISVALCVVVPLASACDDADGTGAGGSGASGSGSTSSAGPTSTGTQTGATSGSGAVTSSGASMSTGTGTPGGDPCSGNPFTPTTPGTGQGTEPPSSSAEQHQARLAVDALRNLIGLPPIAFNAALNQASQAHSDYCTANPSLCPGWHQETAGAPGFTGVNFFDRDSAAGYNGNPRFEVMASGLGADGSIQEWVETVYHRTPFITPDMGETGFGHAAAYDTMDFGNGQAADPAFVTNYPVHGQKGVPVSFGGNEGPTPPAPPAGFPSGSVISIIFPSAGVHITKHDLFDSSCASLPHVAGGQDLPAAGFQQGFLGPTVVLYANAPLASGASYTVNVEYTLNGQPGHRTFQFTTQ
ncbi:MAG: CAP domain-containing protein [Polyangiaceae bacterium]